MQLTDAKCNDIKKRLEPLWAALTADSLSQGCQGKLKNITVGKCDSSRHYSGLGGGSLCQGMRHADWRLSV